MSIAYRAVGWNRQKRRYDLTLLVVIVLYLAVFVAVSAALNPALTAETLLIRGFGTGAFLLLHVILSIGPLARLDSRFNPLLYNRRHLGVSMFFLALGHSALSMIQFHSFSDVVPVVSIFTTNPAYGDLAEFPFQTLGFLALVILFLMAATSHDFWLRLLTPPVWKGLHMLVYVAYGLLVAHVALGALQVQRHPLAAGLVACGFVWLFALHVVAGLRELRKDRELAEGDSFELTDVGALDEIPEGKAIIVTLHGERVAVYKHEGQPYAVSNVCRHQAGPVGEGRIVNGCITCPWHGFQYRPGDGKSPPPFHEQLDTYPTQVREGRVLVLPRPNHAD